jgi:hypothetical protein
MPVAFGHSAPITGFDPLPSAEVGQDHWIQCVPGSLRPSPTLSGTGKKGCKALSRDCVCVCGREGGGRG